MEILIVPLILLGFIFGFIRQVQYNIFLGRSTKLINKVNKRKIYGNYVCTVSYFFFLVFLILNLSSKFILEQFNSLFLELCFISALLVFISKLIIIPKEPKLGKTLH